MRLDPFLLERWLLKPSKYDLASAGITKLKLKDVTAGMDPEMVMSYGVLHGSLDLREKIAALYKGVDAAQVLVTTGTAEANLLAMYRLLEPGDEFVTLMPTYLQCVNLARSLGAVVKTCALDESNGYALDLAKLKSLVTERTKIILLVNPNNPTGSVLSNAEMKSICEIADQVGAWVLCDGALRTLEVDGELAATPVEFYGKGIATGSVSKVGLAGARIGWLISNQELMKDCWAYRDYTTLGHSNVGEHLAALALAGDTWTRLVGRAHHYVKCHSSILGNWVRAHGDILSWVPPRAGHTAFIKYALAMDSVQLCERLLQEEGVLIGPGDFFCWPHHLRVRYSCDEGTLLEGLERFDKFLKRNFPARA
jgi:aspartate/methionine/tyrosine aminotransferase